MPETTQEASPRKPLPVWSQGTAKRLVRLKGRSPTSAPFFSHVRPRSGQLLTIQQAAALLDLTRDQFNHRYHRLRIIPRADKVANSPLFDAEVLRARKEEIRQGHSHHTRRAKTTRSQGFRADSISPQTTQKK